MCVFFLLLCLCRFIVYFMFLVYKLCVIYYKKNLISVCHYFQRSQTVTLTFYDDDDDHGNDDEDSVQPKYFKTHL